MSLNITDFLNHKRLENKAINTIISYEADLEDFEKFLGIKKLSAENIRGYLASMQVKNLNPATLRRRLSSIKEYMIYIDKRDEIPNINIKVIAKLPDFLTLEEAQKVLAELKVARDRTIFKTLFYTGMRISELTSIPDNIEIGNRLKIVGKGRKERIIFLSKELQGELNALKTNTNGALFKNKRGGKLSVAFIERTIRKAGFRALKRRVHPHLLRHSMATKLFGAGLDILSISQMLGHSSVATTQIYTHLNNDKLEKDFNKKWNLGGNLE